jgi:hypothetical protein
MQLQNFGNAKIKLINHCFKQGMTTEQTDDVVELAFRMASALVADTTSRLGKELENIDSYIGAYQWELSTEKSKS